MNRYYLRTPDDLEYYVDIKADAKKVKATYHEEAYSELKRDGDDFVFISKTPMDKQIKLKIPSHYIHELYYFIAILNRENEGSIVMDVDVHSKEGEIVC